MKKYYVFAIIAVALGTTSVQAENMSAKKRAQLEAEVRGNAEVQKDLNARQKYLDRAARAAKGIDNTIDYATKRSGTNFAYKAGKKVGDAAVNAYNKRKNK